MLMYEYAETVCWLIVSMAMVRAELCCLQELAYVSITGSKRTAPMAN
jgi:hypothetical protein